MAWSLSMFWERFSVNHYLDLFWGLFYVSLFVWDARITNAFIACWCILIGKGKLGAYAMKRIAAGAHLPTSWIFDPTKRPDDRTNYCLGINTDDWRKKVNHNLPSLGIAFSEHDLIPCEKSFAFQWNFLCIKVFNWPLIAPDSCRFIMNSGFPYRGTEMYYWS